MEGIKKESRIHWLDNLRTVTIFLVVLYHVGGVYEAAGLWGSFWIVDDPSTIAWVGIVGIMFDIMVMPTMFYISGYLTPPSLKNKAGLHYIKGKMKRLVIPWIIAVFTLIPLYNVIFLYSRNLPQKELGTYFHFTSPTSQNWLWFLPVLFLFNILYLIIVKTGIRFPKISMKAAVLILTPLGLVSSFFMGSLLGFRSWTLTPFFDFENERLLMYFMAFLAGVLCYRKNIFSGKTTNKKLYILVNSISWVPITIHIIARVFPFIYPEGFAVTPFYRLIWWSSFYLSLLCMLYLMIEIFRRYFNKTGKTWKWLNRNSYGVYLIHVVMIGIFGTLLMKLNLPVMAKYPLLIILTYFFSNLVVSCYKALFEKKQREKGNR